MLSQHRDLAVCARSEKARIEIEREDLAAFCRASTSLERAYHLIQEFLAMVHKREGHRLDTWLEQVSTSDLPELQSFARCGSNETKPQ